jgi:putative ABC transport system permease protein
MGMESPIGKRFKYWGGDCKIIGVIKDFHYRPLREEVEPLIMRIGPARYRYLTIRIKPENSNFSGLLKFLEKKWERYRPDHPFEFHFLNETIDNLYAAEQQMSKIIGYFTFLAIFVACLGLFGLTSYTIEQRTKEICIRKVLGASLSGMVVLLTKELSKWVFVANIFAWPIAWFTMNKWLQDFVYKAPIGIWTFILAGAAAMFIAMLTISYQSIKAATVNPIKSLRYE